MDLALDERQERLRQSLAELLAKESPPERVRAAEPLGFDDALWTTLVGRGALAPDQLSRLTDLAVAAEEVGRHLAPVPFVEAAVTRRLLARVDPGGPREGARPLTTIALTGALPLPGAKWAPEHPLRAGKRGDEQLVPAGAVADEVVVLDGDGLRLVALTDDARRPVANLGSSPLAVCWFETEGERVDGGRVLASGAAARAEHARAVDEWRVLTAAALVGLAQGALDLAVAHVCTRQQFGVPIGSFQAVQHRLADLVTDLDGARLLVWEAAWAADADSQRAAELAAMAFVWAASTATRVATESLHFHGGYGFTLEHDIQLFFRRAKAWPLALDDPDRELQRLGDLLYGRER